MGKKNYCYDCKTRLERDNQVKRNVAVCPKCQALTHLETGQKYTGRITVRVTRSWIHNRRITDLARTCGQVAYMPEPTR